jgi:hypothetical protein
MSDSKYILNNNVLNNNVLNNNVLNNNVLNNSVDQHNTLQFKMKNLKITTDTIQKQPSNNRSQALSSKLELLIKDPSIIYY